MKIVGLNLPDSATITFHANGIKVKVALNIPKEIVPFVSKNNLQTGKVNTYFLEKNVPLNVCTARVLKETFYLLLERAKRNINDYKREVM